MFTIIHNQLYSAVSTLQATGNPGVLFYFGIFVLFCFHSEGDTKIEQDLGFLKGTLLLDLRKPLLFLYTRFIIILEGSSFPKMPLNHPIYMCEEEH